MVSAGGLVVPQGPVAQEFYCNQRQLMEQKITLNSTKKEHCIPPKEYPPNSQVQWRIHYAMGLCGKLRNRKHFQWCHSVEGCMDSNQYQHIRENNVNESVQKLKLCHGWLFQQDNDPPHCSKSTNFTKAIVERQRFRVLEWSSQSPDINIIQN